MFIRILEIVDAANLWAPTTPSVFGPCKGLPALGTLFSLGHWKNVDDSISQVMPRSVLLHDPIGQLEFQENPV